MLVAHSGFFVLGHKSRAEKARIWFSLRKQNQVLEQVLHGQSFAGDWSRDTTRCMWGMFRYQT